MDVHAEHLAFDHAVKLMKEYRKKYEILKAYFCIQLFIIVLLLIGICSWMI